MKYDLVFEGGGAKGIVFVGAMQALEKRDITIGRLLGTSAGAITATLLAAGYNSDEMLSHLNEMEGDKPIFTTFMDTPSDFSEADIAESATRAFFESIDLPLIPEAIEKKLDNAMMKALLKQPYFCHLFSFVERGGWFSAHRFVSWLEGKLDLGTFQGKPRKFSQMNFKDFREATGVDLTLIGADTTANRVLILNHITAPDCPVVWATRMSMSVPLLWQEVRWRSEWGLYRGKDITNHTVVDGGLLSNFPIELFVSDRPQVLKVMGEKQASDVIGLLIDEKLEAPGLADPNAPEKMGGLGETKLIRRLRGLVDTMTQAHDKMVMDEFEDLVVHLPAKGVGTTEFDLSEARKTAMVTAGRRATESFLAGGKDINLEMTAERVEKKADDLALDFLSE
jgi:predicted acylesterase/phospholipase RssA